MQTLDSIKGVLFDIDGVLYVGREVIPGAIETVALLRQRGLPLRFMTNTTTESHRGLHSRLTSLGFNVSPGEILSAPQAALVALRRMKKPRCLFVVDERVRGDFAEFTADEKFPEVVVVGDIGKEWNYDLLNQLFGLVRKGAHLIALHKNRFWQTEKGLQMDIDAFVTGIEYATGKRATIMGKPSPAFFNIALHELGLPPHHVAIVGDDIDSDIGGGQDAGMRGILVQTGKYREDYARESGLKPDLLLPSVTALPQALGL
ncbi:MAG: TIGR01458 family HAD-type hydrolase [Turneriella sp.]|nr:TIGR01458 family HAD-type hydrolase [Turneriella sp.]